MKKSFTLLTSALLLGASLSASAAVDKAEWKEGNYYHLKSDKFYLALDGTVSDSVVVKTELKDSKAAIDSALWQITQKQTSAGPVYQFKNKATKALLAFAKKDDATTKLDPSGITEWTFSTEGRITGYYGDNKSYNLNIAEEKLVLNSLSSVPFTVESSDAYNLKINELGDGLSTFFLNIKGSYEGNIFAGKELVAKAIEDEANYFKLQYKGDTEFEDGKAKYLGVDTLKTNISDAEGSYGLKFKADSVYPKNEKHSLSNDDAQKFRFAIDLKNDSIALFVKKSPIAEEGEPILVVYAELDNKKVLTVSDTESERDLNPKQGVAPFITTSRGEAVTLPKGDGVYFLKNAGKGKNAGKYLYGNDVEIEEPSVNNARGQWLIKENNGVYTIVDRLENTKYAENSEIFAVKGIENAYTVAGKNDTLLFSVQPKVDLDNKYLGNLYFSDADMKEKSIKLNMLAVGGSVPISVSDSLLVAEANEDGVEFRLVAKKESKTSGAQLLGDTLYSVSYQLIDMEETRFLAENSLAEQKSLIMSNNQKNDTLNVSFELSEGKLYKLVVKQDEEAEKYISYEVNSNLVLVDQLNKSANFEVEVIDAPTYLEADEHHFKLESNGKFLTMNPLTLLAEMKSEGQEITKAGYTADNFSLKIEKADTVIPGKPVYLISTCMIGAEDQDPLKDRFYLAPIEDKEYEGKTRLGFIKTNDTIKTSKNSPAYFALKQNKNGSISLESIKKQGKLVSESNNRLVLSTGGLEFMMRETEAPVANEVIAPVSVVAVGGHNSVTVMNAKDKKIVLTDILGKIIGNYLVTSDRFTVPANRGLVIVAIEGEVAQKVIVK